MEKTTLNHKEKLSNNGNLRKNITTIYQTFDQFLETSRTSLVPPSLAFSTFISRDPVLLQVPPTILQNLSNLATGCHCNKIGGRGLHVALRIGSDVLMVVFSSSKLCNHNYTMKKQAVYDYMQLRRIAVTFLNIRLMYK